MMLERNCKWLDEWYQAPNQDVTETVYLLSQTLRNNWYNKEQFSYGQFYVSSYICEGLRMSCQVISHQSQLPSNPNHDFNAWKLWLNVTSVFIWVESWEHKAWKVRLMRLNIEHRCSTMGIFWLRDPCTPLPTRIVPQTHHELTSMYLLYRLICILISKCINSWNRNWAGLAERVYEL